MIEVIWVLTAMDLVSLTLIYSCLKNQYKVFKEKEDEYRELRKAVTISVSIAFFLIICFIGAMWFPEYVWWFRTIVTICVLVVSVIGYFFYKGSNFERLSTEFWARKFKK